MAYCDYIAALPEGERRRLHQRYHDRDYGFPLHNDNELFGRLLLEINQAGLSWETILRKEDNFRKAYDDFDIKKVAAYGRTDRERLLADAGIIRNRLKIDAAIYNAQKIQELQSAHGSFERWLENQHPLPLPQWVKLFKQHFKFTGGEIVNEFLMSIGYLPGAHSPDCPRFAEIVAKNPLWMQGDKS